MACKKNMEKKEEEGKRGNGGERGEWRERWIS